MLIIQMANTTIVYGTTEGHTRKVCDQIATWLREAGHSARLVDCEDLSSALDLSTADNFILAGSIHEGHHQKQLAQFVKDNRDALAAKPSLFLSVSLSAIRKDEKHQADVQHCIDRFLAETEWKPSQTQPVAGALLYTQYNWMKRTIMRMISEKEGGDVDTTKDFEYTDWAELRQVIETFCPNARPLTSASGRA